MAKAESIDTVILPTVMPNAMMKLLSIISQNGALLAPTPCVQIVFMFSKRCVPDQRHWRVEHRFGVQRGGDKGHVQWEQDDEDARISRVWLKIVSPRRFSIIGSAPYFRHSGTAPP